MRLLEFSEEEKKERKIRIRIAIEDKYNTLKHYKKKTGMTSLQGLDSMINSKTVQTYLRLCRDLRLDPYDLISIDSFYENRKENLLENRLLSFYCMLNRDGRERFLDLFEDVISIEKYRRV